MTENRETKEHLGFTLRELSHRTKNMLAVVQGLAHMIARRSDGIDDFQARFNGCVQALAYSHDLLVQHDWQGSTLEELLRVQLAPFGGVDGAKIAVQGPEVYLTPPTMQSLGLIMHELGTNATKHGALSISAGTSRSAGRRERIAASKLIWRESGGPPVAAARAQRASARWCSNGSGRRSTATSPPISGPRGSSAPSRSRPTISTCRSRRGRGATARTTCSLH